MKPHYSRQKDGGTKKVNANVILTIFVIVLLIVTFIIFYKYATAPVMDGVTMSCAVDVTVASTQLEGSRTGIVVSKGGHVFMVDIHGKSAHTGDQRKLVLRFNKLNNGNYRLVSSDLLFDANQLGEALGSSEHGG